VSGGAKYAAECRICQIVPAAGVALAAEICQNGSNLAAEFGEKGRGGPKS